MTIIGERAFSGTSLTYVNIPKSVTRIENDAFSYCYFLTSVTISNGVISIGENAFKDTALISVIIPDSVTSIGFFAFADCSSLSSVIIPASVSDIGVGAFFNCPLLTATVYRNSYASRYCSYNDIKYIYQNSPD